jgi:hypothetical protein
LHPDVSQVFVADRTFPTWWEALDWSGRLLREFRRSHVGDAGAIAEQLMAKETRGVGRARPSSPGVVWVGLRR